jgi:hypothetical protein
MSVSIIPKQIGLFCISNWYNRRLSPPGKTDAQTAGFCQKKWQDFIFLYI